MSRRKPIEAFEGKYRFLSNFYPCKVKYQGIYYPTVEHGFQACKSLLKKDRLRIGKLPTAAAAKQAGRKLKLRKDWETYKEVIMYNFLKQKFKWEKNPILAGKLKDTGDAKLIEGNWWGDIYWGVCDGKGQNRLGVLLMKVRDGL